MQRPLWLLNRVGREREASNACRLEGEPSPAASAARGREAAQREGTQEGIMTGTHCVPGTALAVFRSSSRLLSAVGVQGPANRKVRPRRGQGLAQFTNRDFRSGFISPLFRQTRLREGSPAGTWLRR